MALGNGRRAAAGTVVVAGGSSASGVAVASALLAAGHRVATVGSNGPRIAAAAEAAGGALPFTADLADRAAVADLGARIRAEAGPVSGLVHLVGGWRGGRGVTGQSDEDYDFLHTHVVTTLRHATREFYDDVAAAEAGRMAIVSATAVDSPTGSGANYVAAKSAAEGWMRSVAAGLRAAQSGRREDPVPQRAAAAIWVVRALVDDGARAAAPDRDFSGFTDVAALGRAAVALFDADAGEVNGARISLVP